MRPLLAPSGPWLFSRRQDFAAFALPALVAFALIGWLMKRGELDGDAPPWAFFAVVLCVDVAHVWTTLFRVYFDGEEFARRRLLYVALPLVLYGIGVLLHAVSSLAFWRALAYVAVFHFVRQQVGWLRLYDRRDRRATKADRRLDALAVYLSCLYPLLWWHAHLPRSFDWFVEGDFVVGLSSRVIPAARVVYAFVLALSLLRHGVRAVRGDGQPGKVMLILTTAACWYGGIVALNSDVAFTLTNVLLHGVPYFFLTYRYGTKRADEGAPTLGRLLKGGVAAFLAVVLALAFVEEFLWDRFVWHDHAAVFGEGAESSPALLVFLVPLLSLPQVTHYALDGLIWRGRDNPLLAAKTK